MMIRGIIKKEWIEYTNELIGFIPTRVYLMLIVVGLIMAYGICIFKGWRRGLSMVAYICVAEYLLLVFCTTVFYRENYDRTAVHLIPFWSYYNQTEGCIRFQPEHLINIVLLVPVVFFIGFFSRKHTILRAFSIGLLISCTIEILQLSLQRGVCEIDDVMNNTIGCVIGGFLIWLLKYRKIVSDFSFI